MLHFTFDIHTTCDLIIKDRADPLYLFYPYLNIYMQWSIKGRGDRPQGPRLNIVTYNIWKRNVFKIR